jgi:hypothetical protein
LGQLRQLRVRLGRGAYLVFPFFCVLYGLKRLRQRFLQRWGRLPRFLRENDTRTLKIGVDVSGGFGDFASSVAFLRAFEEKYPGLKLDFFSSQPDFLAFLYKDLPCFHRSFADPHHRRWERYYDLMIYLTQWVTLTVPHRRRLQKLAPQLERDLRETAPLREALWPFLQHQPSLNRLFVQQSLAVGRNRVDIPGDFLGLKIDQERQMRLESDFSSVTLPVELTAGQNFITVHDGVGSTVPVGKISTKQWPLDHWNLFVEELKAASPGLLVVQLGGKNSRKIQGVDLCYVGKLSMAETSLVLKKSRLHVDGESGLVRLAYLFGVKSVVLFGSGFADYLALKGNVSVLPSKCGGCFYATPDWDVTCPRGLEHPECMSSIDAHRVVLSALQALKVPKT